MRQFSHGWLALRAMAFLDDRVDSFTGARKVRAGDLRDFHMRFPSTFVRGAWFPDTVIKDNILSGHAWKYGPDPDGRVVKRRPPPTNLCRQFIPDAELAQPVSLWTSKSDLPDRCEALGMMIRDAILITNGVPRGDVVAFNDSQIALMMLMLAHYACDAHVPVHCDRRDLNKPSKIHSDLETYWEDEILRVHGFSEEREQFHRGMRASSPRQSNFRPL